MRAATRNLLFFCLLLLPFAATAQVCRDDTSNIIYNGDLLDYALLSKATCSDADRIAIDQGYINDWKFLGPVSIDSNSGYRATHSEAPLPPLWRKFSVNMP